MEAKPNLNSTVAVDLPEEVFIESTGRPSSTSSTSTKHKGDKCGKVIDILCDIHSGCQQKKANEEHWREKEEACREREEEHRSMEHFFEALEL